MTLEGAPFMVPEMTINPLTLVTWTLIDLWKILEMMYADFSTKDDFGLPTRVQKYSSIERVEWGLDVISGFRIGPSATGISGGNKFPVFFRRNSELSSFFRPELKANANPE
jgi:hypothetical protein